MPAQTFKIPDDIGKVRLDKFLVAELKQPRNQIQKLIKDGYVKVNNVTPAVHHWLKSGEVIAVSGRPTAPEPEVPKLKIVDETDDYLVVNKPAGVLVHPAVGSVAPLLTMALIKHCPDLSTVGDPSRPGIVHRLDKDASGLMVVAKTKEMYDALIQQFKNHTVKKVYTVLVEDALVREEGVIDFPLGRSKTQAGLMAARPQGAEGKKAETRFTVTRRFINYTLLEVVILTGRSHQIRAHLKAVDHPVVGDKLYHGRKINKNQPKLNRLFLEATTLGFDDLSQNRKEYNIPLDVELKKFLGEIK